MNLYSLVIIDDEPATLEHLSSILNWKDIGFYVAGLFTKVSKLLEYIESNHVDVIISDIKMPDMSGIDLAQVCNKLYPDIKIVFLSAYRDFEYAREAIRYNVFDYITKPFTYQAIYNEMLKLSEALENDRVIGVYNEDKMLFAQQQLFTDLFYGTISNSPSLEQQFHSIQLNKSLLESSCIVLRISINHFNDYIKNNWKRSNERLYHSILSVIRLSGNTEFYMPLRYNDSDFEVVAVNIESDEKFQENIRIQITKVIQILFSEFKMSVAINISAYYNKLKDVAQQKSSRINERIASDPIIEAALSYIHKNYAEEITLIDVANHVLMSPNYFSTYYKQHTNENFTVTLNNIRIKKAMQLLTEKNIKSSLVFEMVGYRSYTYFYKLFTKCNNITPGEYRKKYLKGS